MTRRNVNARHDGVPAGHRPSVSAGGFCLRRPLAGEAGVGARPSSFDFDSSTVVRSSPDKVHAAIGFSRYLLTFRAVSHLHEMSRQAAFIDGVLERVGALPGVESVTMTERLPFETTPASEIGTALRFVGRHDSDEEPPRVLGDTVSPGYLATLGLRLEAGRGLAARDGADAPPAVVVNRAFARRFVPR